MNADLVYGIIANFVVMTFCLWAVSDAPNWAFWMFAMYLAGRMSDNLENFYSGNGQKWGNK